VFIYKLLIGLILSVFCIQLPLESNELKKLKVGTVDNYLPCSDKVNNSFKGLSLDLWRIISEINKISYEIESIETFNEAVDKAAKGDFDLIVSCHKITSDRLRKVEYAVPYTNDGLAFLTKRESSYKFNFVRNLFADSVVIYSLFLLTFFSIICSLLIYKSENGMIRINNFTREKREKLMKLFTMFMVGEYGDRSTMPVGMATILLFSFIRLIIISKLVGSSVFLFFNIGETRDISSINNDVIKQIAISGVAVNKGTKMDDWLKEKISNLENIEKGKINIKRTTNDQELIKALVKGNVKFLLSDISVLNRLKNNLEEKDNYYIPYKNSISAPQAFIFGSNLNKNIKKQINITISELIRNGTVLSLLNKWNK
tara:strand:+ start:2195 stop:3307 length:1113 start_codon:yes stop_codon:yes gene_type:complete